MSFTLFVLGRLPALISYAVTLPTGKMYFLPPTLPAAVPPAVEADDSTRVFRHRPASRADQWVSLAPEGPVAEGLRSEPQAWKVAVEG